MIITRNGLTIRMGVDTLRVMGRATQGVKLINLREGDEIAAVAKVVAEDDEQQEGITVEQTEEAVGNQGNVEQNDGGSEG